MAAFNSAYWHVSGGSMNCAPPASSTACSPHWGVFSEKLAVLGAHAEGKALAVETRSIGPALIFERLWQELGIDRVLAALAGERRFGFSLERAVFVTVLHRLFAPGSDRAAEKWKASYAIAEADALELHHFYRAMGWLGEPIIATEAHSASMPRTRKDLIEERLFDRRDLFSALDIVFFDTTSIYFEGEGGETLGQYGHSKDHRPDLKQMVVGVVVDNEGRPIMSELWPGNTADVKSLVPIVDRLRGYFKVNEVCIVADRGMISQATIGDIKQRGWQYILGVRMRRFKEANEEVLARAGRYQEVYPKSDDPKAAAPLKVKEVWVADRRYVVCLNEDQATKDRHEREAIVASLKAALKAGDKQLIGNRGYRKYVKTTGSRFAIDEDKLQAEARFDGKWVLTTNTDLAARELALKYKQLWLVEAIFRTAKSQIGHAADLPQMRRRDPRPRVLLVLGAAAARGTRRAFGAPAVQAGVGGHRSGSRSSPGDRSPPEWQAVYAAPRGQG